MNKIKCSAFLLAVLTLALLVTSCSALPGPIAPPTLSQDMSNFINAQMTAIATDLPRPTATPNGDLGWGDIQGKVTDSITHLPIVGAKITCQHFSVTSTAPCNASVLTGLDGKYIFPNVYFVDGDYFQLKVQAPGYIDQTVYVNTVRTPNPVVNVSLAVIATATPQIVCTQPACGPYEALVCDQGNCIGGCGFVCVTPVAICTPPLCAIGTNEVYTCSGTACPAGCGTTCATYTPAP
jgi:hypothetical protein